MMGLFAPSTTASTTKVIDTIAVKRKLYTFSMDVSNAFLHANDPAEDYIGPLLEWKRRQRHPGMRWCMLEQLYGKRKAPAHSADFAGKALASIGWEQCDLRSHLLRHRQKVMYLELHINDMHGCGLWEDTMKVKEHSSEVPLARGRGER